MSNEAVFKLENPTYDATWLAGWRQGRADALAWILTHGGGGCSCSDEAVEDAVESCRRDLAKPIEAEPEKTSRNVPPWQHKRLLERVKSIIADAVKS